MRSRGTQPKLEGLGPDARVKKRAEFQEIQSRGRRVHTTSFVVLELPRDNRSRRIGVTVTKKVGCAVERNHVKRVVREVFRRNRELFPEGFDFVLIAKSGAPSLGYEDALAELRGASSTMRGVAEKARRRRAENPPC